MKTEDALDILDVLITTNYRDGYIGEQALWAWYHIREIVKRNITTGKTHEQG